MGVTGLWKLIEPCGQPVPVETLESKILAVDISIWLHQAVKGFQDNKGSALANAHLLGLFHRLCKLLYFRVKPVFVFDGSVPQLKLETIARRQQQRSKLSNEADRIQALLLQSLAKEKVVQQALGANAVDLLLKSPTNRNLKKNRDKDTIDDVFKLPELPESKSISENKHDEEDDTDNNDSSFDYSTEYSTATEDSSFDESNPQHYYNANLQNIDVRSKHFRNLPADVRHDILVDIKETRKQSSWGRLHELPSKSDDFSTFQMKRLLKRRAVQQGIEEAEQEMGGRSLTYNELSSLLTEEGIVEPTTLQKGSKQISSDENTRFLLVRDLKKKLTKQEEQDSKVLNKDEQLPDADIASTSQGVVKHEATSNKDESLGSDYEHDLELAIALSLEDSNVYSSKDYDYNSDDSLKLNKDQRKLLKNAAVGPARAYMIEYGGMNEDEVVGIMEHTQNNDDFSNSFTESTHCESTILNNSNITEDEKVSETEIKKKRRVNEIEPEGNDSESDLEEVPSYINHEVNISENELISKTETNINPIQQEKVPGISGKDSDLEEVPFEESPPMVIKTNITENKQVSKTETTKNRRQPEKESDISDTDSDLEEVPFEESPPMVIKTNITENKQPEKESDISDTDSDLEEVPLENSPTMVIKTETEVINQRSQKGLEVIVDPSKSLTTQDDLFADIFEDDKVLKTSPTNLNMDNVLLELQKQAQDVTKIKLDDIKIDSSIIVLSDDDNPCVTNTPIKIKNDPEIVEILDGTNENQCVSKTPTFQTPPKKNSILEYFEVDYLVKRTPETPKNDMEEKIPKVKSPFYVNKTPKSGRKRSSTKTNETSPSPMRKLSKATKSLFQPGEDPSINPENLESTNSLRKAALDEASQLLKEQKTSDELNKLAVDLAKENRNLESERNRQERMGMSISQRMNSECQELLRLFGIPYIVAPMEAEAQCAFLDSMGLTHGTITDDSDIWLFGGRTVYKNFFAQNKHVLEFRAEEIQKLFNCDRLKMIQLACLVGSDYTTGIHGIGTVTALEILATFSSKLDEVPSSGQPASVSAISSTLRRFRDWWLTTKTTATPQGSSTRLALHKKLKNIELHEGFPNTAVIDAYLMPKVDDNKETFSWGYPDVESIREFAKKNFGWTKSKTDDMLMPVMKKLSEKKSQATITNYFNVKSSISNRQLKVSKRVQNAIDKMSGKLDESDIQEKSVAKRVPPKKRKVNPKKSVDNKKMSSDDSKAPSDISTGSRNDTEIDEMVVQNSNTSDVIPQRQKRLDQMRKNKEKAVKVLKESLKAKSNKKLV